MTGGGSAAAILMRRTGGVGIGSHFRHTVGIVLFQYVLRVLFLLLLWWLLGHVFGRPTAVDLGGTSATAHKVVGQGDAE